MPEPAGFVYVETALGALNRRNRVRHIRDVVALANTGAERYISHARGDETLVEWPRNHFNSSGNGTVEGFAGKVWDASLRFDFDNRDNPAVALVWVRDFMARLALADVPLEALRIYFSGAKGFHLEVPHTLFGGFEPDENLHIWEKAAAVELMGSTPFDHAVYDKLRLWRLTNSFNSHGGHYKVRLSIQEALGLEMPQILALAEHPRTGLETAPDDDWNANPYLVEVWARARSGQAAPQIATDVFAEPAVPWSTVRSSAIFDATLVTAIAESWPRTPIISRHSDFLLPLSGFLARQGMEEPSISGLLKAAAQQANDRSFLDDRTRHWEAEIERLAHDSVQKIAAGQPAQGLPTIVKNWPELGDYLNTVFVARAHTEYAGESPDDYHLAAIPRFPLEVLPEPMHAFVVMMQRMGLPANLACGAALAAVAGAAGGMVEIEGLWTDRMVLWVALLAPRGAGKSPVQSMAFKVLREHDVKAYRSYQEEMSQWRAQKAPERANSDPPQDRRLRLSDSTLSAIARRLQHGSGSIIWDADELSKLLLIFGEYQRGPSADRARFLELWTGEQWQYERVGTGSRGGNDVDIMIEKPTMVVCGGLQTGLHSRLGGEEDGLRPRWLPHLSDLRSLQLHDGGLLTPGVWDTLLLKLLSLRGVHRGWRLDADARLAFLAHQKRWKAQAAQIEGSSVSAALQKADVHLLRIVGVFCEAESPGKGGMVEASMVERAAMYMDAVLDCWRALPEQERLSLTFKDERLDACVDRVAYWLEGREERQANSRDLLSNSVGGIRNAEQLKIVLDRYESTFKGCVVTKPPGPRGGRPGLLVLAPRRRPYQDSESGVWPIDSKPEAGVAEDAEEVCCRTDGVASQTPEIAPQNAIVDLEQAQESAETAAAGGFDGEGLLATSQAEEPSQQTEPANPAIKPCCVCGKPLDRVEERNVGQHLDCRVAWEDLAL